LLRTVTLAAALILSATAAVAQGPTTTPATKPAAGTITPGTYDIELAFGGGVMPGSIVIATAGDSLSARINVGDHAPPPVRKIKRNGSSLTVEAGADGVNVVYDLTFSGDDVSGKFTFNGDPGLVTGKRRK
jgi:hypothetical protein